MQKTSKSLMNYPIEILHIVLLNIYLDRKISKLANNLPAKENMEEVAYQYHTPRDNTAIWMGFAEHLERTKSEYR